MEKIFRVRWWIILISRLILTDGFVLALLFRLGVIGVLMLKVTSSSFRYDWQSPSSRSLYCRWDY